MGGSRCTWARKAERRSLHAAPRNVVLLCLLVAERKSKVRKGKDHISPSHYLMPRPLPSHLRNTAIETLSSETPAQVSGKQSNAIVPSSRASCVGVSTRR